MGCFLKKDLMALPSDVISDFGYGLYQAQMRKFPDAGKILNGFKGTNIVELRIDHKGDTFRAVYTIRFKEAIFVLHVFKKKSKKGISTPKKEMDLVRSRLATAEEIYIKLKKGKKL